MEITSYTPFNKPSFLQKQKIVDFLYTHLDEFGDPKEDISNCLDYAMKEVPSQGGFAIVASEGEKIAGVVIVNQTGMAGYIPENILVYIAVDKNQRGKGVGKKLMNEAIEKAEGNIALHVEPENPAKFLYEKLGFTNKYLEMRLDKTKQSPTTKS
ncbi:MAG: GNAT family N-acetyltransferase [Bacteroidetes bacterium]|nr:GNAT family N-acetyltransferase [Bacteroidota bacterium]